MPRLRFAALFASLLILGCGADESAPSTPKGAAACAVGDQTLADGSCRAPGIPEDACTEGFVGDGDSGCAAVLPDAPCPKGQLAVPGETSCHDVSPCGAGTYGDIPVDATTQYVDGAYAGGASDGSVAKPWTTIGAAIAAAGAGGIVAIAAGTYTEDLLVAKPVRIYGKCPAMVQIGGTGLKNETVRINGSTSSGAEVHGVAIVGPKLGFAISGGHDLVLDHLWVHGTVGGAVEVVDVLGPTALTISDSLIEDAQTAGVHTGGVSVTLERVLIRGVTDPLGSPAISGVMAQESPSYGRSTLTMRHSVIERCAQFGAYVTGSDATIEHSVIRDGQPDHGGAFGRGVGIELGPDTGARATLVLSTSVIENNIDTGVFVGASDATIETTVVRGTQSIAATKTFGEGIVVEDHAGGQRGTLKLSTSLLADNHAVGLGVFAADATVDGVVVRDTASQADGQFGTGILCENDRVTGQRANATINASVVQKSRYCGIAVGGSDATIQNTAVHDTVAQELDQTLGFGISIEGDPDTGIAASGTIIDCAVERSQTMGINVVEADATIRGTSVADTAPQPSDGAYGDGISVITLPTAPSTVSISMTSIARSARSAISSFGSAVHLQGTQMECAPIDLDGETVVGLPYAFDDAGGNVCGCGSAQHACQVVSSNLAPPAAPSALPVP